MDNQEYESVVDEQVVSEPSLDTNVKGKKRKGIIIGVIAAVAVLIVGIGAFAAPKAVRTIKRMVQSTDDYYKSLEKDNRNEYLDLYCSMYGKSREIIDDNMSGKTNVSFEVSDTAKSILDLAGIDSSKLNDLSIDMKYRMVGAETDFMLGLLSGDASVITANMSVFANENTTVYMQVPELSPSFLTGIIEDAEEMMTIYDLDTIKKVMPEEKVLNKLVAKYTDIYIDAAKGVTRSKETVYAGELSEELYVYEVNYTAEQFIDATKKVLEAAKGDSDIKAFVEGVKVEYSEFQAGIDSAIEELSNYSVTEEDEFGVDMSVYVDNNDNILGRTIEIGNTEEKYTVSAVELTSGNDFESEIYFEENGNKLFNIAGKGIVDKGIINGTYDLYSAGLAEELGVESTAAALLTIKLENIDISDIKNGKMSGGVVLSTGAVPGFETYAIKMDLSSTDKTSNVKYTLMMGSDEVASIIVASELGTEFEGVMPADSDKVYDMNNEDEMMSYMSEIDIEAFMATITEKTGIDLSSLMMLPMGDDSEMYDDEMYEDMEDLEDYDFEDLDY